MIWGSDNTRELIRIRIDLDPSFREAERLLWISVAERLLATVGVSRRARECRQKYISVQTYYRETGRRGPYSDLLLELDHLHGGHGGQLHGVDGDHQHLQGGHGNGNELHGDQLHGVDANADLLQDADSIYDGDDSERNSSSDDEGCSSSDGGSSDGDLGGDDVMAADAEIEAADTLLLLHHEAMACLKKSKQPPYDS